MQSRLFRKVVTCSSLWLVSSLFAQDIFRSTGIGIRGGLWKAKNYSNGPSTNPFSPNTTLYFSEVSGSLYFIKRLKGNLFLETSISSLGLIYSEGDFWEGEAKAASIIPFLIGCRYDLLPSHVGSVFQPYMGSGLGPYYVSEYLTGKNAAYDKSKFKFGLYAGVGVNVLIQSWFTLNCDFRYHFVNFQADEDYGGFLSSMGICFIWGRKRELFRIEGLRVVVKDIYPAYYQLYNTNPVALVSVKNTVDYSIEVNVNSNIKGYSERSLESGFIRIDPGEKKDLPVFMLFGSRLMKTSRREQAVIDLKLEARTGGIQTESVRAFVTIHNRNAWNGEIDKLGFYVTPDDERIMTISRSVVNRFSSFTDKEEGSFAIAKEIFNELKRIGIRYRSHPSIPFYKDDRVKFAAETEELKTGDCDDLVVLYSSLLESVGIKTAFVDVQDPEKEVAHVYLMFDTGVTPEQSGLISSNEKRFVIREKASGKRTVWIPVEATFLEEGFEAAWKTGALRYLQEGLLRNGLSEDWVRIIDIQ